MTLLILAVAFFGLTILGMPITYSIGLASLGAMLWQGTPLVMIPHLMFDGLDSFILVAIPMFILVGEIMLRGALSTNLTDLSDMLVGRLRGGLGHVNILASIFFAGITGSAAADTTAIGSILIPTMKERGYSAAYSTAVTIASSILGPIIPPSLTFILYAMVVGNISIGGLFLAGIIPGLITGLSLMILHHFISYKRKYEKRTTPYPRKMVVPVISKSLVIMVIPVLIIMGVLSGAFTATESAAVASAFALIICFFLFRTLHLNDLPDIFFNTAKLNGIMLIFLATSTVFGQVMAIEQVPIKISEFLLSITTNKYIFLFIINIVLIILGCVLDTFPAIIIFAPILAPVAASYRINPLHFGVVFCVNQLIGLNTPPIGTGLFIGAVVGRVNIEDLVKEVTPFTLIQFIVLMLITYIPVLTLWVPGMAGW